jgi:hypothetical protein
LTSALFSCIATALHSLNQFDVIILSSTKQQSRGLPRDSLASSSPEKSSSEEIGFFDFFYAFQ